MLDIKEFAKLDFLKNENNFKKNSHVDSKLILGNESTNPFISISIPTFGRADLLKEAIESCLDQLDYENFNIVITDNDPERDNATEKMIKSFRHEKTIYYKNRENIGALANFNRCIEKSNGTYCIMLCTDDLLKSDYLKKVSELVKKYPDGDMFLPQKTVLYGKRQVKTKGYHSIGRMMERLAGLNGLAFKLRIEDFILYNPGGGPTGIVYKRESFLEQGGFDPNQHPTGDRIFYQRMTKNKVVYLTLLDSGLYRFIDNISLEKGIYTVFMEQDYHVGRQLADTRGRRDWFERYFRGWTYYRLHKPKNKKAGIVFELERIERMLGREPSIFDFAFFCGIWMKASVLWMNRMIHEKRI